MKLAGVARTLLLIALLGLDACAGGTASLADLPRDLGRGTQRVVITYSIAQGMAESYVMSGRATSSDLLTLVGYDHAALVALRTHLANPSWNSLASATAAISALMDYTTTMDARAVTGVAGRKAAARQ